MMNELKEMKATMSSKILEPQKRLSPTSINTFYKCPRQYFYQYVAKIKVKPNIHLVKGSIVHKVLEDFFKVYPKDMESALKFYYDKAVKTNDSLLKFLELPDEELKQELEDCWFMIEEYFSMFKREMKGLILGRKAENEQHAYYLLKPKFREKFVEDKELHCCGFIDRINEDFDGLITLGDYKTSKKYGIGLPMDYVRQLSIYSLLYYTQEKRIPDFVAVDFLRYGKTYNLWVTPSLLQFARNTITDVWDKTRSADVGDYPLYESNLCGWCQYNHICSGQEDWEKTLREQKMKELIKKQKKSAQPISDDKKGGT
ncbi:PD-(D/E)XK nuclease family protein [Oceanihabitans sediminis]|uniref:RecB family exonuclease n=1 Tax=Oceanihabitans sediminis TaxID=1812012 RepID=UPI00299E999E|nr:PD-(D/E)XK nuclease family protein [Oceanihabitans sediminis]MDX1279446.1 PD-(D/E)XK nuclease family protein [Oceanihabitans sediminis]